MTATESQFTVSTYLIAQLERAGVSHMFGVPGDYTLDFLDYVMQSSLQWVGTCNELNAGYAADGYARLHGLGVVAVTYGVGGLSALNAIAGAYAEQVPVVIISGAPPAIRRQSHAMMHHLTRDYLLQLEIFRKVTVDAVMLTDAETAPDEIDRAIARCMAQKRPVYIELPMDMVSAPCRAPGALPVQPPHVCDPGALEECVGEIARCMNLAEHPVLLVGVEVARFGLDEAVLKLVETIELPFATTVSSKSVLPELHPQFIGLYQGAMSREDVQQEIESSDCVLSLGVWMTDLNTGGFTVKIDDSHLITVNTEKTQIGHALYENVPLAGIIGKLTAELTPRELVTSHPRAGHGAKGSFDSAGDVPITVPRFYQRLSTFLDDTMILIAATGESVCAAPELYIEEPENFLVQAYYLSIGYCIPAALGVSLARPEKRAVVLAGDGAFQMTAQEVSTLMRMECPVVVFLLNNGGYMIERKLHQDGPYNDIQNWNYHQLPAVFGDNCTGLLVRTEDELEAAMAQAERCEGPVFIELCFPAGNCSDALEQLGERFRSMSAPPDSA